MTEHLLPDPTWGPGPGAFSSSGATEGRDSFSFQPESSSPAGAESPAAESSAGVSAEGVSADGAPRRRRRGRRGRRGRGRGPAGESGGPDGERRPDDAAGGDETSADGPASGEPAQARPDPGFASEAGVPRERGGRRRRRGRRSGALVEPRPDQASGDESAFPSDPSAPEPQERGPESAPAADGLDSGRPRRRRRGRGRGRDRTGAEGGPQALRTRAAEAAAEPGSEADDAERRRRRGRRGGRRKKRAIAGGPVVVEVIPGEEDELLPPVADDGDLPELPDDAHLVSPPVALPARRGELEEDEEEAPRSRAPSRRRKNVILVNAADPEEMRVAVVEGTNLTDFLMTVRRQKSYVNDIYRGKVVNLEPAIGAAFVDFGEGRNGFLHTSDVLSVYGDPQWSLDQLLTTKIDPDEWDSESSQPDVADEIGEHEEGESEKPAEKPHAQRGERHERKGRGGSRMRARPRLPITDLLKKGDSVVVQVTKDAIGDKGPTLTTYISIPGRYLVLMPSMSRTGVSRKIEDEKERRRLKKILQQLAIPPGMGVIVRTAGVGSTKADLQRDLDYLLLLWDSFGKRLSLGRGPAPLYEESDVAIRTIRDLFTNETESVVVDDRRVYDRVREFTEKLMPENVERIRLHEGNKPLFHAFNVEQEFERLFARRIDLPSGGSIVFDQAEALVAIDVNSGKTRSDGFDFEDIALKTNLDAVPEIARQIRLRDLGGIIVIDFIDMQRMSSRRQIERAFRDAMSEDRARSKLGRISQFGLLELTRQRLGPGLVKMIFTNCPRCRGSGRVRTIESRAGAILRRLGAALALKGFTKVEVRTQPEVVDHLKKSCAGLLKELEERHEREIALFAVPDQVEDSVLRYLRADGREVRPGGRRKR